MLKTEKQQIIAVVVDANGDVLAGDVPTVAVSDPAIADVENGFLVGKAIGSVTLTASYPGLADVAVTADVQPGAAAAIQSSLGAPVPQ